MRACVRARVSACVLLARRAVRATLPPRVSCRWLGEDGCEFTGVIHANAPTRIPGHKGHKKKAIGGYNDKDASWEDAAKLLRGKCTLTNLAHEPRSASAS